MAVYRLTRTPDAPGGQLVGADSAAHAVALARYQLQQYGHTGWPCNMEPVYVHRVDGPRLPLVPCDTCTAECTCEQQHRAASELTRHDQAAGIYNDDCPCAGGRTDNHGPHED